MDVIYRGTDDKTITTRVFYSEYQDVMYLYENFDMTVGAKPGDVYNAFIRGELLVRVDVGGCIFNIRPDMAVYVDDILAIGGIDHVGDRVIICVMPNGEIPESEENPIDQSFGIRTVRRKGV